MAEAPINPGSLAEFEAAGDFASPQEAQVAYFERLHVFRLAQAAFYGIDLDDLHRMEFAKQ